VLEASETIAIPGKGRGQNLERYLAPEPRIPRTVTLAHPAGTQRPFDLVKPSLVPAAIARSRAMIAEPSIG
jgi:hypothetical protein